MADHRPARLTISQERRAGFEQALSQPAALLTAPHVCVGPSSPAEGLCRLIKGVAQRLDPLPGGLVTTSYILMEGVLDHLLEELAGG